MGFFFTLVYLIVAYLTPYELFGTLADYHVEVIIVSLAVICSLPNVSRSGVLTSRAAFAVSAFSLAIFVSVALTGWFGGAVSALYGFLQTELAFFLVAINCTKKRHFQLIVLALFLSSTFFMLLGLHDLSAGVTPSTYLFGEGTLRRIRGLGFVNDPNDFGQAMVSLIPAIFLWKRPGVLANIFLVGLPVAWMLTGLYFTHSRGAIVALTVVVLISARRKIGTVPAALLSGVLFAGGLAAGWSGGRDVSMDGGADRLDLWAAGLDMIKSHPLFGVGTGGFADANGITAHNSVVICAAETGIIGLFFWTMILVTTLRDSVRYAAEATVATDAGQNENLILPLQDARTDGARGALMRFARTKKGSWQSSRFSGAPHHGSPHLSRTMGTHGAPDTGLTAEDRFHSAQRAGWPNLQPNAADVQGMIRILIASMAGFLTAGWFLSRAISMSLFMYCGMLYAAHRMATEAGIMPVKEGVMPTLRWSFGVTLALLVLISIILRLRNFAH